MHLTATYALTLGGSAIVAVIVLIAALRLNPFIVLFAVSIAMALAAGMPPGKVVESFEGGAGHVLGHIGVVIALGTMLGKMLTSSGGADQIANTMVHVFGRGRGHWAMMIIGLLVGLPVFFEVGFVLLIPLVFSLAKKAEQPMLMLALPMAASLSVVHAMLPPHPAALLAQQAYHASIGLTIVYGLMIGIPTALVAGPLYARFIVPKIGEIAESPIEATFTTADPDAEMPPFGTTVAVILLPIVLMLLGSLGAALADKGSLAATILGFIGNTDIALMIATVASFYVLGLARGLDREKILKLTNECLAPTAVILVLVGGGGGFGRVLIDSGVSRSITNVALEAHVPLIILAWMLAAIIRLASGSATVAMTTAAGIVGPIIARAHGVSPELLVLATGAGSVAFGPVNDAGFWQIKEYLGLSVGQTLRTWSVVETLIAGVGLGLTLLASLVV